MKATLCFIAGFLCAAAAVAGLWRLGAVPNALLDELVRARHGTVANVTGEWASPDGEYVATATRVGNGYDWCEVRLNVHRRGVRFDWEHEYVCITGCDARLAPRWEGDRRLRVAYAEGEPGAGVKTYQKFSGGDGAVEIAYELGR